ncbi:MAG: hypothetical protein QME79_14450 [Bacillota bacterium]|nr:hypothetical protein [Bacillota bacterium]
MARRYFIAFAIQRAGESEWTYANDIISKHPVDWLAKTMEHENAKYGSRETPRHFVLLFWQEIDPDLAAKYESDESDEF